MRLRLDRLFLSCAFGACIFLTGCSASHDKQGPTSQHHAASAPVAELVITVSGVGTKQAGLPIPQDLSCTKSIPAACHGRLACIPSKSPSAPCAYLAAHAKQLFRSLPTGMACTDIYGGPEKTHIEGTVDHKLVAIDLARTNGCEIARWQLHEPLWAAKNP